MKLKSFEVVCDFIKEIFKCNFLAEHVNEKLGQIGELMKARSAIMEIMKEKRPPLSKEFMEDVFPVLEVALQWNELRERQQLSEQFVKNCRKRMKTSSSNFLGVILEIDMATRCLLSNWKTDFLEDYTNQNKQIDLLIEKPNGEKIGLECTSKRGTENIDESKINETISEKSEKFDLKHLKSLGIELDRKIIIVDLTRKNHEKPKLLENLNKIVFSNNVDGAIITWREDFIEGERHSLRIKYKSLGKIPDIYFTTTWAAEFFPPTTERGSAFALRKYVESEPRHGKWGPEETKMR
jgi:hypothetical protein